MPSNCPSKRVMKAARALPPANTSEASRPARATRRKRLRVMYNLPVIETASRMVSPTYVPWQVAALLFVKEDIGTSGDPNRQLRFGNRSRRSKTGFKIGRAIGSKGDAEHIAAPH